ncbi:conserved hypothetical protein [Alkalilimnicola ehrlichii MLHE-1]|uniref:TMEM205-like domain-containing protein n=1 Tax=Alkalilimnicola ehrlichii (strain ATCC BAA-1101 / DSM 17681 / MLHE-1) TaxID=187272 RepID=Q0A766_ALKEH|nr:conserved hypothetical protein [Alkalilimnicola ehrlichii MLHE-1]
MEWVLLVFWAGSLWAVGYVVVPGLFETLDQVTAGEVAGEILSRINHIGLFCLAVLLLGQLLRRVRPWATHWRLWLVLGVLALTAFAEFVLAAQMAEVKASGEADGELFASLHRTAASIYLVQSVIAFVLVLAGTGPAPEPKPAPEGVTAD